jgi:chromosome segregation ATPase
MSGILDPSKRADASNTSHAHSKLITDQSEETVIHQNELEENDTWRPLLGDMDDVILTKSLLDADVCEECKTLRKSLDDIKGARIKECESSYLAIRKLESQLADLSTRMIKQQVETQQLLDSNRSQGSDSETKIMLDQESAKRRDLEDQIAGLRFQKTDEASKYETRISSLESEVMQERQLKTSVDTLCISLKQKEERISRKTQYYSELSEGCQKEISRLQRDYDEKSNALQALNSKYTEDVGILNQKTAELMTKLDQANSNIRSMEDVLESVKTSRQKENESLKEELESCRRQQDATSSEQGMLQKQQVERLEAKLNQKTSEMMECELKMLTMEKELIKERKTGSMYIADIANSKAIISKITFKYNSLKAKTNENDRKHKQNQIMFKSFIEGVCGKNAQRVASLYNQYKPLILDTATPKQTDKEQLFTKLKKICEEIENDGYFKQ